MLKNLSTRAVGQWCENLAWGFLVARGMHILHRNYHCRWAELDLVGRDQGTLVFVEVKARLNQDFGSPFEAVDPRKQKRLVLAARHYMHQTNQAPAPCRFDLIAIQAWQETPCLAYLQDILWHGQPYPG